MLFCFVVTGLLLLYAKSLFLPIAMGVFFALMLYPVVSRLERWRLPRVLAIFITLIVITAAIVGLLAFFSTQIYTLFADMQSFGLKMHQLREGLETWAVESLPITRAKIDSAIENGDFMSGTGEFLNTTFLGGADVLATGGLVAVYTFMFLVYRTSIHNFILLYFSDDNRAHVSATLAEVQKVAQNYFGGILLVILCVGTMNTIGLYFIGIDFPFLFGFFAAFLTVIPYVGTTAGGILPAAYAFLNYDSHWKPVAVVILYVCVQQLEGNFVTPRILGNRVSVNALFAFSALLLGGFLWGIPGMVLSIPFTAMLKVICSNVPHLKMYGHLLSDEFIDKDYEDLTLNDLRLQKKKTH